MHYVRRDKMEVSVSILGLDYANVEDKFLKIEPYIDLVHLDVMDGVFVPNISF
jgi:ribulose-phosphate 3-epimerase